MATTEQKRQKKLVKQRSKALKQRRQIARKRNEMKSLSGRLRAISHFPVAVSQIGEGAYEPVGMSTVFFGRQLSDGRIMLAVYLIDLGCLGVKDSYVRLVTKSELADFQSRANENQTLVTVQPSVVLSLVEQAVEYARSIGFEPRGDYAKMRPIFGDIDAGDCSEKFPFGDEDGKPLYVRGPNETLEQASVIRNRLETKLGKDNFDYIVPIHPSGRDFPDLELFEDGEMIDGSDGTHGRVANADELMEDAG